MKQHRIISALICVTLCLLTILCSACGGKEQEMWDTSRRGNTDANINNLGLSAAAESSIFYVGTETEYDLIYEADENGVPQKALTGLTGYIQFLNITEDTLYFLGVTYDEYENRSESIFSADLNGENKNCIYTMKSGSAASYLSAVGDLLIYASSEENGKSRVCAVNPADQTEAELFSEKGAIRSLQIEDSRFYYITGNKIRSVRMDGTDKKTLYESKEWIGNMVILSGSLYFTQYHEDSLGHHDSICRINKKGEDLEELFSAGKWINAMNAKDEILYFDDQTFDNEGNFKEAVFYAMNTKTAEITEVDRTEQEYTGMEICGNLLIYHLTDEHLTAQIRKLP